MLHGPFALDLDDAIANDHFDKDMYTKNLVAPTRPLCITIPGLYKSMEGAWRISLLSALPYAPVKHNLAHAVTTFNLAYLRTHSL